MLRRGMNALASSPASHAGFAGTGRFEVLGLLGQGGMGIVYRVLDRERGVELAMKRLETPAAEGVLRFKAEFRALRDLEHPNLLRLGELFESDGQWFFTMEAVAGSDFLGYVRTDGGEPNDPSTRSFREGGVSSTRAPVRDGLAAADPPAAAVVAPSSAAAAPSSPRPYDEKRLRAALVQLTLALDAIHRAGMVHRDVKPANVLVEPGGRVVLLDFGIVAELGGHMLEDEGAVVGTVAYMPPEQACGEGVTSSADWYAAGTMLYQALTGRLPFEGSADAVLTDKVLSDPPSPRALVGDAPPDLSDLCMRMLARDAALRPSASEILTGLGAAHAETMLGSRRHAGRAPFVGRAAEIASVRAAASLAREGHAVTLLVEGPSGIGKTAMVAHALDAIRAEHPDTLVLRGRCHENETVPYNAFDGVVDAMSRVLRSAAAPHALAIAHATELLRIFPALGTVPFLADAAPAEDLVERAPAELRQRAVEQLRALLANLARTRPVVLLMDDVHWADAESVGLLAEITRPPAAPMLLLATARPTADGAPSVAAAAAKGDVRRIVLQGLSEGDARALLATLAQERDDAIDVDAIVGEAGGHPMFLGELLQFSVEHRGTPRSEIQLDDALLARIDRLPRLAQRALEVVAVAGVPLHDAVLARALRAPRSALAAEISVLRSARLLRASGARLGNVLEPFHDRVREAIYRRLSDARRVVLHRRLGLLLEEEAAPHEVLLNHFDRCGEGQRAVVHALAAAEAAASGLAFERAAALYGYAVRSGLHDEASERALRVSVGEMLRKAGRPNEAAEAFAAAAETGTPSPDESFELRRRVAEQYLMGGYLREGLDAAGVVLAQLGESRPSHYLLILLLALWHALRLKLARLEWTSRDARAIPVKVSRRLDVYWSLGAGLVFLDSMRSATFNSLGAVLCLRSGDDDRIARAACAACIGQAGRGDAALTRRLVSVARRAAERAKTDHSRVYAELADASYTFFILNDPRRTLEQCERARTQWAKVGQRGGWESDLTDQIELWALAVLGDLRRLAGDVERGTLFARACGNRFREFMLRASFPQGYLLRDAPAEGDADVRDAVTSWSGEGDTLATPGYWALKSRCLLALYQGSTAEMARLEREFRRYDRSALGALEIIAMESADIRAKLAMRQALAAKRGGEARAQAAHLARARRFRRRVERSPLPFARSLGAINLAAYVYVERGPEAARPLLEAALPAVEGDGWGSQAAGLRYALARIVRGAEGAIHRAAAEAWVASQDATNPERLLDAMALTMGSPDDL
jgi:hypothetical protein